jgi:Rad3-related DNA helicase
VGKSAIARALQLTAKASIIVSNNVLLDQYGGQYPSVNMLKGKDHYPDEDIYKECKRLALAGEPTIYNPLSLYYSGAAPDAVIVDEAHRLPEMLELLCGVELGKTAWKYPSADRAELAPWMLEMVEHCKRLAAAYRKAENFKDSVKYYMQADKFQRLSERMAARDPNFVVFEEERRLAIKTEQYLVIKPVKLPSHYYEMVRGTPRVLLMSATIPRRRAEDILGSRDFHYLDLQSPIPVHRRAVLFRPGRLTARSEPAEVAAWIKQQLAEFEGNAIVHVTYSMGKALAKYFPDAHIHTSETKAETLKQFKKKGGLWIAAGCAEGIDLPGDFARLNLVPILPFANIGDPIVKARMALPHGQDDYALNALITFIQQVGRSTRGEDDHSIAVIGDNRLAQNVGRLKDQLPKSFLEAIKWNGQLGNKI